MDPRTDNKILKNVSNSHLDALARGTRTIYIATRLYDIGEKQAACHLESAVLKGVEAALGEVNLVLDSIPTFMPYRDTVEDSAVNSSTDEHHDLARKIYEDDLKRLSNLFALICYLNDVSKDDGICMEIGFAFGKGAPTIAVVSDFIHYSSVARPSLEYVIDPVLLSMCGRIIHYKTLPSDNQTASTVSDKNEIEKTRHSFKGRLELAEEEVLKIVESEINELTLHPESYITDFPVIDAQILDTIPIPKVLLDFSGRKYEWSRIIADELQKELEARGFYILQGNRHDPQNHQSIGSEVTVAELGSNDIAKVLMCDMVVIAGDGAEVDSGSAALLGFAHALGKVIILYYSGNQQTNSGARSATARNLMLLYASNEVATSYREIPELVEKWFK